MLRQVVDHLAYFTVRLLVAFLQVMPTDMGDALCRLLAATLSLPVGIRRTCFDHNMTLIFPAATARQRQALCRAMWRHLLLMVCEIAWAARRLHLVNWHQVIGIRHRRVLLDQLLAERPTVIVTGHFGNFEIGGYLLGLMGFPALTIARRLDNAPLHRFVQRFRQRHGQFMVDKQGCAPLVDRHLARGGTLSILADQHAGDRGCWSEFLGARASCHKALALFSLASDAPLVVSATRRLGRPMDFESGCYAVADPAASDASDHNDVRGLTQWYNNRLGEVVSTAVEQYWWVHRRWRPEPAKRSRRGGASPLNRPADPARAA